MAVCFCSHGFLSAIDQTVYNDRETRHLQEAVRGHTFYKWNDSLVKVCENWLNVFIQFPWKRTERAFGSVWRCDQQRISTMEIIKTIVENKTIPRWGDEMISGWVIVCFDSLVSPGQTFDKCQMQPTIRARMWSRTLRNVNALRETVLILSEGIRYTQSTRTCDLVKDHNWSLCRKHLKTIQQRLVLPEPERRREIRAARNRRLPKIRIPLLRWNALERAPCWHIHETRSFIVTILYWQLNKLSGIFWRFLFRTGMSFALKQNQHSFSECIHISQGSASHTSSDCRLHLAFVEGLSRTD